MMENGLENLVIPQHLAIDSMKDSGYKNTAYAIAELVDNSIQAGESTDGKTEVEIILLEKKIRHPNRITKQIDKIAVYDNACGMDKETLRLALQFGGGTRKKAFEGIGKFGMGLPNSSISQCNKLEVWSWQNNEIYYCYIDTEEISRGKMQEVPLPERQDKIPIDIRNKITGKIKASGTLIVWSELERLTWKRHNAFFKHTEILIGRMYRYFIAEKQCSIRMIAYDDDEVLENSHVRANDPLFLMKNTIAPAPYDKEPAFEQYGEVISISGNHYGEKW